uniref:Plus3 domain-containing protein n=1 Tax=Schistocephalus solidus TaxID=70667 RepID=A0A0X3PUE6_SCHSO
MSAYRSPPSRSYSSDEAEWTSSRKTTKKTAHGTSKKPRTDNGFSDPEEGEIPSDALEDDEDDVYDDDLYCGEEDRQRLLKMSEREREEELYRRAERREAMQIRNAFKRKLKEQREKEKVDKGSRSNATPEKRPSEGAKTKKPSTYADIYSSDSEDEESFLSDASLKVGLRDRKSAMAKQKEATSRKFQKLIESRTKQQRKKESTFSDSGDDSKTSPERSQFESKKRSSARKIYSSGSSDSDSNHSAYTQPVHREPRSLSTSSRSSSDGSSVSSDDGRGRSRSPVEELVSTLDQLSKIRLSRYRFERWVHMPFFDELVKGCFARINIGLSQGVPVYRCGEIVDVVETAKTYDLGNTRTNKGIVLRVGKDQHTFRLVFVSNSEFLPAEFESWLRHTNEAGLRPPTLAYVAKKHDEIQKAINTIISDERVFEQIIQSKRRFQKAPTNFALRKAELLKQREVAEGEGDTEAVRRLNLELDELETQAEKIERKRTIGFKSITSINQRNRELSVKQAEEAIIKEAQEAALSREEDPFTRIQSKPVIVTKSYLEKLRNKRNAKGDADEEKKEDAEEQKSAEKSEAPGSDLNQNSPCAWNVGAPPEESLHAIHDFEIDIDVNIKPAHEDVHVTENLSGGGVCVQKPNMAMQRSASAAANLNGGGEPNRRFLNLQEYKRRRGLI